MKELLFGAAYYDEYMPYDRLEEDIRMMKKAHMNTVRIAESTWSTYEPQEGVFDFSHVERVMDAMEKAGINVIIGTPTYAVPAWMVKLHPEVLAETKNGRGVYGARQIMDITNPAYLFYSERIIRKLMECTAGRKCVIGYQIDNETKYYGTSGANVQAQFIKYLREKFHGSLDALNQEFGLSYWSNRIDAWEDFPDVRGTINGSLGAEFEKFQRTLVDEFLAWQAAIVNEYRSGDQFITHNFDYEWRGHSYGLQPDVNHLHASRPLTIAGVDIYHPSQDGLTGVEIAFGGDISRSLKNDNYLVMETEAQGFPDWTPYKGQLRLQAYSHIASGANSVMYWHWHSIHNSFETYWKGVLSHDFRENDTYREACAIGREFSAKGKYLANLKKHNDVAILVSNESLTALKWFAIQGTATGSGGIGYNDVFRWAYDTLYHMNVECDIIWPESDTLNQYKLVVIPALYAAEDRLLEKIEKYVEKGGNIVVTFKSAFANENIKVSHDVQPHILRKCLGVSYSQFAFPKNTYLKWETGDVSYEKEHEGQHKAEKFMELLVPETAEVLASYQHYNWKDYAAVTRNHFGKGTAYYIGCMTDETALSKILSLALKNASVSYPVNCRFPVIIKKGINSFGKQIVFYFNYSSEEQAVDCNMDGTDILTGESIETGKNICISPWDLRVFETARNEPPCAVLGTQQY